MLEELSRRRQLDEQSQWDFRALDQTGSARLPPAQALLLFQVTHGDTFSMSTWHAFLKDRDDPGVNVAYDEMRALLCAPPGQIPSDMQAIAEEKERMIDEQKRKDQKDLDDYLCKKVSFIILINIQFYHNYMLILKQ